MAKKYFVVGGVYQDTQFKKIICHLERFGPFQSYDDAKKLWQKKSLEKIDDACCRYTIEELDQK